jgi:hypothetical protein
VFGCGLHIGSWGAVGQRWTQSLELGDVRFSVDEYVHSLGKEKAPAEDFDGGSLVTPEGRGSHQSL